MMRGGRERRGSASIERRVSEVTLELLTAHYRYRSELSEVHSSSRRMISTSAA